MADTIFGIDKGIIRAFLLMVVVVGVLTTFFLSEYVAAIVLGSVSFAAINGTTFTDVTNEGFTVFNTSTSVTELANNNIEIGTMRIFNATDLQEIGLGNFTIIALVGNISVQADSDIGYNNSALRTNYTFARINPLAITADANAFLFDAEDDFVTTFTNVNTGVKFAAALITVVAVILVFASFLPRRNKDNLDF